MAIQSDEIRCQITAADRLNEDKKDAGRRLAQRIERTPEDRLLLFFYDSIKKPASPRSVPVMNASTPLIEGIAEVLETGSRSSVPV